MSLVARDHQHDSVDIINFSATPPSPIAVVQTVSQLGPYHIAFDTPGIGSSEDGAVLVTFDAPIQVLQVVVVPTVSWENGSALGIFIGGEDYLPPDDIFSLIVPLFGVGDLVINENPGYRIGLAAAAYAEVTSSGAILAQCSGNFTIGEADVFILTASPA